MNKLEKIDSEFNYETLKEENIFWISTKISINLDKFKTVVKKIGVEIWNYVQKNNFDKKIAHIV